MSPMLFETTPVVEHLKATCGAYLIETTSDAVLRATPLPALSVLTVFGDTNKAVSPDAVDALVSPRCTALPPAVRVPFTARSPAPFRVATEVVPPYQENLKVLEAAGTLLQSV